MNELRQLELFEDDPLVSVESVKSPEIKHWRLLVSFVALLSSLGSLIFPAQITAKSERFLYQEAVSGSITPVEVLEIVPVDSYSIQREYTGQVKADRRSDLGFERSGKIIELSVQEGDVVEAGQPLARLDTQGLEVEHRLLLAQRKQATAVLQELQNGSRSETIAAAEAKVADLEDQLSLQQAKRQRREDLYQEGAIAREALDDISFGEAALRDRMDAARSQLQELQAGARPEKMLAQQAVVEQIDAQIADLDLAREKSILRAPYGGTIADRWVNEGTVLDVGQPVVSLVEVAIPEVEVGVQEDLALTLRVGESETVKIAGKAYPAVVSGIKPEIDSATRTRLVILQLESAAAQAVIPQQIARLQMSQTVAAQGFWLPLTALQKGARGLWSCYTVAVAQDQDYGIVERQDVEVLHTEGERALVRGTLNAGDRIIASGVQRIVPNQRVAIQSDGGSTDR